MQKNNVQQKDLLASSKHRSMIALLLLIKKNQFGKETSGILVNLALMESRFKIKCILQLTYSREVIFFYLELTWKGPPNVLDLIQV